MKRKKEPAKPPPPLEEIDPDQIDAANGGFLEFILPMLMGGGMGGFPGMGGGFPGMGGGFPFMGGGFPGMPGMPGMPQMPNFGTAPNTAGSIAAIGQLLDLLDRRGGNGTGRRRR